MNYKKDIEKIKLMNLSNAFIQLFNKLIAALEKENMLEVDIWVNNLYPSVKLENISNSEKEFLKKFLSNFLVQN